MSRELGEIVQIMAQTHHRPIDQYSEGFLAKTVDKRQQAIGAESAEAYVRILAGSSDEADSFCRSLNIGYSEFFRNSLTFALLEQWILPSLLAEKEKSGGREIRVWSAGCAAGQEIYSVAILLDELKARSESAVVPRLFATDHSARELDQARQGVYDASAVRQVRLHHLKEYFNCEGETYRIADRIKSKVAFFVHDLLDERASSPAASIYGDFDLIFCSNLLYYYRPDIRQDILRRMHRSLSAAGYLATGEAERDIVSKQEGFRPAAIPSSLFQKTMRKGDS